MIYIDVSAAVHSRAGLGRYSEQLALNLDRQQPGRFALFHNQGQDGRLSPTLSHLPRRSVKAGYKPWRMAVLLAHLGRLSFNRLLPDAQLFHSTEHLLMPLHGVPTVLTVHDLIYKLYPAYHKKLNYWFLNLAMPLFCRRAAAIIAVSEAGRQDIIDHYQVEPAKIHVVYEAAADHFRPPPPEQVEAVRNKYGLPGRFLLHLSTIEPRKNLDRLVDALKILRRDFPDLCLVLAGGKGWLYNDFFARIAAENLETAVQPLGWVPDEDLPAVIAAAALAVQPSLYEGFGLPILEHMACGQVVAASHSSSHPEVGGQAAAYFDPENTAEMTATIHRLLTDRDEYHHRRQLSLEQAAQFSWTRAAQETIAIYDELLEKHHS
jgi:glycosyltransferase involved in cell wall biosynthesis